MLVGVLTTALGTMPLEEALNYLKMIGVQAVELGTGGFPGNAHCNPDVLLREPEKLRTFRQILKRSGIIISALSCHGNAVHPNPETAAKANRLFERTVLLAEELGLNTVVTFSGCPGDCPNSQFPNWVTCPWPEDFLHVLDYQWNERLLPYWRGAADFAVSHGVTKIAIEMHPGFCVYNPQTMLRLRNEIGECMGANYDPSHLIWQQMDPVASIRELKDCIFHVHAKDCRIDPINTSRNGVLDTQHYGNELERSWIFRTIGYGHGYGFWKDILSTLRLIGYDGSISIEHEDSLLSQKEGLEKAVRFLNEIIIREAATEMWWA